MEIFTVLIFFLLITSNSPKTEACFTDCPTTRCGHGGLRIQFPFQVQGQQQVSQCGCSGFELSCEGNSTRIHFQNHGSLVVKSISYEQKRLNLVDPNGCVHGVFLNLNLSLTPFHYFYVVRDYLYLNCTEKIPSFSEVSCLSDSGSYVYAVKASLMEVPRFCRAVKTVAIPFEYSPYLADDSFGLALTWEFNQSKTACQTGCSPKASSNQVLKKSLVATGMGILMMAIIIKVYHSKKQNSPREEADQKMFGNSLGAYEALEHDSV